MSHEETPREFTATITFVHTEKPFAVGASFAGAESFRSFFPSNTLAAARPAAGSGFFASALELVDRGGEAEASPAGRSAEAFARSPREGAAARSSRVK